MGQDCWSVTARHRGEPPTTTCSRRWASGRAAAVGASLAGVPVRVVVHGACDDSVRQPSSGPGGRWAVAPSVDERWDEMDHQAVLDAHPPEFEGEPDERQFQAWFEKATARWLSGEHDHDYTEPWIPFRNRVLAGFEALGDGTTVVVTSAGPVSVVVAHLPGVARGVPADRARRRQRSGHQGRRRPPRPHPGVVQRARPPFRGPAHLPLTRRSGSVGDADVEVAG